MFLSNEHYKKFNEDGYVLVKNLLDSDTVDTISRYFEYQVNQAQETSTEKNSLYGWEKSNKHTISEWQCYGDPLIEVLLGKLQSKIEDIVKKQLSPTYSYSRIYVDSNELTEHTDRPSCEYSVTINIATIGDYNAIIMNGNEYILEPGDGVVYLGCEIPHARKPLNTTNTKMVVQTMLHYVDKNSINKDYKYDYRDRIGYGERHNKNEV